MAKSNRVVCIVRSLPVPAGAAKRELMKRGKGNEYF